MSESIKALPYAVTGLAGTIGRVVPIDEFARQLRFPDRKNPGGILPGARLRELLGLESKSWDPARFSRAETLTATARRALEIAGITAGDLDVFCLVTCTPLQLNLDQDAFTIAEQLDLPSSVTVLQVHAGCAGLPRVLHTLAELPYRNVLTLCYNLASPFMTTAEGALNPLYADAHSPRWFSAALFADAASAAVWSRQRAATGVVIYARDTGDPLIRFAAGGAEHPPGRAGAEQGMTYEIATQAAAAYYRDGMALNHFALDRAAPGWLARSARYYLHQTGAAAVEAHYQRFEVPHALRHCHAHRYGNVSSASTLLMAHEDFESGNLAADATLTLSTVGAGPERGAASFALRLGGAR